MTSQQKEKLFEALGKYREFISNKLPEAVPVKHERAEPFTDTPSLFNHCLWMLDEIERMANSTKNRYDKCMRWLCFVQGALSATTEITVEFHCLVNSKITCSGELCSCND